jgi:hypothetical protein
MSGSFFSEVKMNIPLKENESEGHRTMKWSFAVSVDNIRTNTLLLEKKFQTTEMSEVKQFQSE